MKTVKNNDGLTAMFFFSRYSYKNSPSKDNLLYEGLTSNCDKELLESFPINPGLYKYTRIWKTT